jgi:hypothetical protein
LKKENATGFFQWRFCLPHPNARQAKNVGRNGRKSTLSFSCGDGALPFHPTSQVNVIGGFALFIEIV